MAATKPAIERRENVTILAASRTDHEHSMSGDIQIDWPSWVPDCSELVNQSACLTMAFFAAGRTSAQVSFHGDSL
ncbi:hypothetical protein DOTSEDRAFT_74048 [Dothistroma septosporum NZE10]|uniref:Uncharacterized protein n=1 Tax=Dothistroma septosporum (strain NZE10 / CBS 128990) TaxID=675120 RepID=N1PHK8_DOTSN|nr:hypothetical protein DOTSEDRAFT_74048 [Dothistroma septosporum NZE10]